MEIISIVSYPFLPARSGGQKGIALFYKYFSRYHSVTIIGTRKNEPSFAEGYVLKNILSDSPLRYINPLLFFTIRKWIRKQNASHLILEHPYYGWLGIGLKYFCGVKLIVHSHNIESVRWKGLGKWWWRILWQYEKMTHRRADFNFFIQDADRQFAISSFGLDPDSCLTVSFGTEISAPPSADAQVAASGALHQQLQVPETIPLLLFNGAFGYAPNREALQHILFRVNPLLQEKGLEYLLLIIGLDIPEDIKQSFHPSVRVLGFVENLDLFLTGCRVFLNPVVSGGGIKTKLVEALAYDLNSVSTVNGAIGIDPALCGGKLLVSADGDWNAFSEAVSKAMITKSSMPPEYYAHFYWVNIAKRAAEFVG